MVSVMHSFSRSYPVGRCLLEVFVDEIENMVQCLGRTVCLRQPVQSSRRPTVESTVAFRHTAQT